MTTRKETARTRFRQGIGRNVAKLRTEQKLTQEALAEKTGIHRVTVARIEAGTFTPGGGILAGLATALSVPVDSLISG